MKKDLIKKDYKKKIELLNYYNQKYYNENNPEISDSEFDDLKRNIIDLEKIHIFLKSKKFTSILKLDINHQKILKKLAHRVPMLSLANAFSKDDLENYQKKY